MVKNLDNDWNNKFGKKQFIGPPIIEPLFLWAFAVALEPQQKAREKDGLYWKVFTNDP